MAAGGDGATVTQKQQPKLTLKVTGGEGERAARVEGRCHQQNTKNKHGTRCS